MQIRIQVVGLIKKILLTGTMQFLIQFLTLLGGILVIRSLPTEQYALYTLANTMLGAMSILTDSGISSGVIAIGGENWRSDNHLGKVLVTGVQLRKRFAIGVWIIITPILIYMLNDHGASNLLILSIVLAIIPIFYANVTTSIFEIPLRLHQDIIPMQKFQLVAALGKLMMLLVLLKFNNVALALVLVSIPQIWNNIQLHRYSVKYVNWNEKNDADYQKRIIKIVKRLMPEGVYSCLSGQLTVWLVALLGSTTSVAQLGALSRFSVAIRITGVMAKTILIPRFARLEKGSNLLMYYLMILSGMILFFLGIIFISYWSRDYLLLILGSQYASLSESLVLIIIAGCCEVLADLSLNLNTCRGWAINPFFSIPTNILALIGGILLLNVSTLNGVIGLTIFTCLIQIIMHGAYGIYRIRFN